MFLVDRLDSLCEAAAEMQSQHNASTFSIYSAFIDGQTTDIGVVAKLFMGLLLLKHRAQQWHFLTIKRVHTLSFPYTV
jgi:hypothetical protein